MEKSKNLKLEYKKCTKCNETKLISEFCKHKGTKDKLDTWCKSCKSANKKQWGLSNTHNDLYVVFDEYDNVQYVGSTTENINIRVSKHKYQDTYTGQIAKGTELGKIMFIRLDQYNLTSNELRYLEQRFINELEPVRNIKNACTKFDFIDGDRLAELMVLSDDLIDGFEDNALVYVDRNITDGLDEWLVGEILA